MSALRHATAVAKIPLIIEHLHEAIEASGKVVFFAHHRDVIDAVAEEFGSAAVTLTGSTSVTARQAAQDRFQTDPSCKLFIGNILAAGEGITLHASAHVVFGELDWRPGKVSQAEDRTHRIGQVGSVLVQHLVFDGSLDATMAHTIVAKQEVIDGALDVGAAAVEAVDLDFGPLVPETGTQEAQEARPARRDAPLAPLSTEQVEAVRQALSLIAGMDPDRARELNGVGFNRYDGVIGHNLVAQPHWTPKQAHLARRIAWKYHRQVGADLVAAMRGAIS
jgi:hypothetical protein